MPERLEHPSTDQYRVLFKEVQANDLVLLGSDGLFDNISNSFLAFLVNFLLHSIANGEELNELFEQVIKERL